MNLLWLFLSDIYSDESDYLSQKSWFWLNIKIDIIYKMIFLVLWICLHRVQLFKGMVIWIHYFKCIIIIIMNFRIYLYLDGPPFTLMSAALELTKLHKCVQKLWNLNHAGEHDLHCRTKILIHFWWNFNGCCWFSTDKANKVMLFWKTDFTN